MTKQLHQTLEKSFRKAVLPRTRIVSVMIALAMLVSISISTAMASNTFSGSELRKVHPTDLLKALSVLEPAMATLDPFQAYGSDPNSVPSSIVLRGPNSFQGLFSSISQMPLIVVDGHVESIERLKDFDISRIESVSVIKNSAQTAIYGLQASHGVILIKTSMPQGDGVNVTYSFDGGFSKADLGSFDMMNGNQKLDWEKKLGLYTGNESLYDQRKETLNRQGSTDWVSIPVRSVFNQKHRLMMEGGDKNLRYRGVIYAQPSGSGVFRGSSRDSHGASAYVGYSAGKLFVSNELRVDLLTADYSNYGNMSEWMAMNPYYAATDSRGKALDSLGKGTFNSQASPLYEASLKTFAQNKMQRIINTFDVRWDISDMFSVGGSFTLSQDKDKLSRYISPFSKYFSQYSIDNADQKGSYSITRGQQDTYQERLWGMYNFDCGRHKLSAKVGLEAFASTTLQIGFKGVGMSSDNMNYISFAKRYPSGERASGYEYYERMLSAYANVSWLFDERLSIDGTVRVDKSSMLAPKKRTALSYGVNAAYNLKKTELLKDSRLFRSLSVSAAVGNTAGYNFDYAAANATYSYLYNTPYLNGAGGSSGGFDIGLVSLVRLGPTNPYLKWRTNFNYNIALSTSLAGVVDLGIEYYNNLTSNIATINSQPMSQGFGFNYGNMGKIRNSGVEFNVRGNILNRENGVKLSVYTAAVANKNKLVASSASMNDIYNKDMASVYAQLVNGNSVDGVYALPSAGIDPATGIESFSSDKMEYMGSMTPKLKGMAGISASLRGIEVDVVMGYSLGGKFYNYAEQMFVDLANPKNNAPAAALQKWTVGQNNAKYQGINGAFAPSSRFVTTLNSLSLSTLRVGYNFPERIANKMAMQRLKIAVTCGDLLYSSSVKNIRGFIYPYSSSYVLSLQATF